MITLADKAGEPLYLQIYRQIKQAIITGKMANGDKLPPTRVLAKDLHIGRNTVENAYAQLCAEGYITSRVGSGFTVSIVDPFLHPPASPEPPANSPGNTAAFVQPEGKFNFQYGRLNPRDFPLRLWRKYTNQALASAAEFLVSYNDRQGELGLRREIAGYLSMARGVNCQVEQIILCSGTLPSLDLICRLVAGQLSAIAVEEPTYDGARKVFAENGYKVIPVRVTKTGIDLKRLGQTNAQAVYVTPSHQFPSGAVMPVQERLKLLAWARKNAAIIIEDDYDGELRYNSRPIPSLQSLDSAGCVIYLGTFSKTLAPGLRLNYMVLPPAWLQRYKKRLNFYHSPVPWLQQKTLELFMNNGHWERHLRKVCLAQKRKHDLLVKTVEELMGKKVVIHGKNAGLHVLLEFKAKKEQELIAQAKSAGVVVYPVSNYWMRPEDYAGNMVLLGFSGLIEKEISEGLQVLNSVWFGN